LRVILYSSGTEVARDEETVRINQTNPTGSCPGPGNLTCEQEPQANTVELTYPSNGGTLGFYRPNPGDGPRSAVFDVTTSTGSETVKSFYTTSLPGFEPTWKACRAGTAAASETRAASTDGVRCEFEPADNPASVTAVAVRVDDTQPTIPQSSADTDTSDAHRTAFSYEQEVTTVELTNATQSVDVGRCTAAVVVTAKDQTGRKIADTNIDVHSAGPSDDLSFDDGEGTYTAPNKPPENHAAESARSCETANNPPFRGSQGEHEVAGPGDIKHIESSTDTNDAGQWLFALHSPVAGANQFTVWADEDSNDRLCSSEAQIDGSVGWGQSGPAATGLADEDTTCPRPNPSGSATPTGSTASPRPSGTSTQPPQEQRSLTFTASKARVTANQPVTFSGQLFAADETCEDNEFIRITRRVHGTRAAKNFASARTDNNGRFELTVRVKTSAEFQAVAPNHDNCADSFSTPVNIQAKAKVGLKAKDATVRRGDVVKLTAKVTPKKRKDRVLLQRQKGRRWVTIDRARLNRRSKAVFRLEAKWRSRTFRARWPSQDDKNEANNSRGVRVRSRR
jgi:hypothetical protein